MFSFARKHAACPTCTKTQHRAHPTRTMQPSDSEHLRCINVMRHQLPPLQSVVGPNHHQATKTHCLGEKVCPWTEPFGLHILCTLGWPALAQTHSSNASISCRRIASTQHAVVMTLASEVEQLKLIFPGHHVVIQNCEKSSRTSDVQHFDQVVEGGQGQDAPASCARTLLCHWQARPPRRERTVHPREAVRHTHGERQTLPVPAARRCRGHRSPGRCPGSYCAGQQRSCGRCQSETPLALQGETLNVTTVRPSNSSSCELIRTAVRRVLAASTCLLELHGCAKQHATRSIATVTTQCHGS